MSEMQASNVLCDPAVQSAPSGHAPHTSLAALHATVRRALGGDAAELNERDNLIEQGLDSIVIMQLVQSFQREGLVVSFLELIQQPTLSAWWTLLSQSKKNEREHATCEVDENTPFGLAPMQQAYWIGAGTSQLLGGVNAHYYVELDGKEVDPARLERAVTMLVARHGLLRARFLPEGKQQVMQVGSSRKLALHDLRATTAEQAEAALSELRARLAHRRMDIQNGEVLDVQLSLLPGQRSRLHLNIEMLVCDARSFQIVLSDLAAFVGDPECELPPIHYSFQRYLAERSTRREDQKRRARAFWEARVPELPSAPQLPLAEEPDRLCDRRVGRRVHRIDRGQRRRLESLARAAHLTLSSVLATAFAEVLAAFSSEAKFLLNLPLFDRENTHPDCERLVGDFSDVLIVPVDMSEALPFAAQTKKLADELALAVEHSAFSGIEVLRRLARERPGDWMMAPVVFTSAIGMGDLFGDEVRRELGEPVWIGSQTPQVWIDHQVLESEGGLLFNWDVLEALFPAGIIDALFATHVAAIHWLSEGRWNQPVPVTLPEAQARVRQAVNTTSAPAGEALLHRRFFAAAAREPERLALAWGADGTASYGELAQRALRIATLLREQGVGAGDTVVVCIPRGPDQIAAVFGVLAAGAAYVPVSIEQPAARRTQICAAAQAFAVLTGRAGSPESWPEGARILRVAEADALVPLAEPALPSGDELAYIIFTSGSTGTPKAIEMSHRAAANTVEDINQRFGVTRDDRVLGLSSLEFDLSVYDVFGPLSTGGALVLVAEEDRHETRSWLELGARHHVTIWNTVPTLLDMFCTSAEAARATPSLRLALVSGDWVGLDLPDRLRALCPEVRFVALGGATEAAIWSNYCAVQRVEPGWRSIPYGVPLRNQTFRVVDGRGRDCPDWVAGELWIGGMGLARGYRGDPALTSSQFVHSQGQRWYRTGDRGRYFPDGKIEFLGRVDHQIKVRGHRIELGEIEATLAAHPHVQRALAFAGGRKAKRLGAALLGPRALLDKASLRKHAADRLPAYMVPDQIFVLDALPLTATGKVDRKALVALLDDAELSPLEGDEPPRAGTEQALAEVWCAVLGASAIGRGQSFFELGGDSLIAVRLLEKVRERFGAEVTHRQLLSAPTVAQLAGRIEQAQSEMEEGCV